MDLTVTNVFLEFFSALIIAIIFAACISEKREDGVVDGYFITILEANFALLVTHAFSQIIEVGPETIILLKILTSITFFLNHASMALFACYIVNYVKKYDVKRLIRIDKASIIILLIESVLWTAFIFNETVVEFSEQNGIVYKSIYVFCFFGVFLCAAGICYTILYYQEEIGKKNIFGLIFYIFLPLISLCFVVFWDATLVYLCMTISSVILYTSIHVNQTIEIATQEKIIADQKNEIIKSRTRLLVSQMQPHFLYNVLNTIYYLCEKEPKTAQKAINNFSDYLRINLDSIREDDVIPFENELKHVQTYIELEKLRFEDELNVEYRIETRNFDVPSLSLQPIVENAVKHGIGKKVGGGTVIISSEEEESDYVVTVSDDGVGFNPDSQAETKKQDGRKHVGMESVENRIRIICNGMMTVESTMNKGTTVVIRIPKEKDIEMMNE